MSGGDRGGVGAMNILIKKTKVAIMNCNSHSTAAYHASPIDSDHPDL